MVNVAKYHSLGNKYKSICCRLFTKYPLYFLVIKTLSWCVEHFASICVDFRQAVPYLCHQYTLIPTLIRNVSLDIFVSIAMNVPPFSTSQKICVEPVVLFFLNQQFLMKPVPC